MAVGTTSERGAHRGQHARRRGRLCQHSQGRGPLSPRPLRPLLTAGWSLTESAGLSAAAYLTAAWLDGRDAGLIAGLSAIWVTVVIRKAATGSVPSLLAISAVVLTVQTSVVLATGELWPFLLQFPLANLCMRILFAWTASGPRPLVAQLAAEPASMFLMLSTAATIALAAAGSGVSALWFLSVLRKLGLRLRFAPA